MNIIKSVFFTLCYKKKITSKCKFGDLFSDPSASGFFDEL